jgi:hypothetical protein
MNKFKIFLAVNNNVVNGMHTMYVHSNHSINDAQKIVKECYPTLENHWFNKSIINPTSRCVVFADLVVIVEQI